MRVKMIPTTYYALLMEYGTTDIPLLDFAKKRFGYDELVASRKAKDSAYPFPVFRLGGQKSPWLVNIKDAAEYIDMVSERARKEFNEVQRT